MTRKFLVLSTAAALFALPSLAFADGQGALTGAAGGAIAGAVVGGPVGAVIGGGAGAVVGGAATGPDGRTVVVEPGGPVAPCASRTTQSTNNYGDTTTTQTTNCQ
jgi:hypothetical protein